MKLLLPAAGDQALRSPEGEPPQAGLDKLVLKMSSSQASSETLLLPTSGDQALRPPEEESSPARTEYVFLPATGAHAKLNEGLSWTCFKCLETGNSKLF